MVFPYIGCVIMKIIHEFIKKESSAGIALVATTLIALFLQNSMFSGFYNDFLQTQATVQVGDFKISKPLFLWVNDGLMAIFFFLIGLEIKRELIEGHLSTGSQIVLPIVAALGGMLIPALAFILINQGSPFYMKGWAIPTATDIAFSLGILSLLGKRVPVSLKIFLMALAIIDDLGAIIIISIFYTNELSTASIIVAIICIWILFIMNRLDVAKKAAYIIVGIILWVSVLKSGVHATLAGVALSFMIPIISTNKRGNKFSMLKEMIRDLHYWVVFLILPLFAFVNAGIDLQASSFEKLYDSVPLGIMVGLFIGKQVGVFGFSWVFIKLGYAKLPRGSTWLQMYGVCILTGIGFTMSLFIDTLAYNGSYAFESADKLSIFIASFLSGLVGYLVLRKAKRLKNYNQHVILKKDKKIKSKLNKYNFSAEP